MQLWCNKLERYKEFLWDWGLNPESFTSYTAALPIAKLNPQPPKLLNSWGEQYPVTEKGPIN